MSLNKMALEPFHQFIGQCLEGGMSYQQVSDNLVSNHGVTRGGSVANLCRYCTENEMNPRQSVPQEMVEHSLSHAIQQVGLR